MSIGFDGIGEVAATFRVEEGALLSVGSAVALVEDSTVGPGTDGSALCGVVVSVDEDGCAGVQIGGLAKVGYSGAAPALGWAPLCVDGAGCVKTAESGGVSCMVISVDAEAAAAVIKL